MASEQYTKKMLDGWYCRSIANLQASEAAATSASCNPGGAGGGPPAPPAPPEALRPREPKQEYSSDSSSSEPEPEPNYRAQYLTLKKKLKYLIYENECFQDALRNSQKRLLKVSRDRSFLLDRLLQYEKGESSTSESEDTESSDDNEYHRVDLKRKKIEGGSAQNTPTPVSMTKGPAAKRKRAVVTKKPPISQLGQERLLHHAGGAMASKAPSGAGLMGLGSVGSDGHMTPEEVERHLQSRHSYLELLPERAPPTVPTEMFSNDPSLDSESNDVMENSPHVEEWFD